MRVNDDEGETQVTITIDVPPDMAARLSTEADRQGKDVPEVVRGLMEQRLVGRPVRVYDPVAFAALVDSFDEGDPEEQRRTLEYLKVAINRDRPGQRSIFGEGANPMPPVSR